MVRYYAGCEFDGLLLSMLYFVHCCRVNKCKTLQPLFGEPVLIVTCWLQDEIDSIGQSRDSNTDPGSRRLLTEVLIQFSKAAEEGDIFIFAATNRMQVRLFTELKQSSLGILFLTRMCHNGMPRFGK